MAAKKTAVKTTAKKAVAKKEVKTETFIQYNDEQTDMDAVLKRVEAELKAQTGINLKIFLANPQYIVSFK